MRALDKSIDEARMKKIANIKKALADGTYHVSAAEVARKLIDQMREP
jgi:flagellar biosynthesis anti-sigma factor FlgM